MEKAFIRNEKEIYQVKITRTKNEDIQSLVSALKPGEVCAKLPKITLSSIDPRI